MVGGRLPAIGDVEICKTCGCTVVVKNGQVGSFINYGKSRRRAAHR
jgi:hypothetical protein